MRGKVPHSFVHHLSTRDHPRLCGEKGLIEILENGELGSPPPMRGKALTTIVLFIFFRITPAYAGKSDVVPDHFEITWDHPRLCGEKFRIHSFITCQPGITPAYAGKRG